MLLFYKSDDENDAYLLAVKEVKSTMSIDNTLDGNVVRTIYMLHLSDICDDKPVVKKFITDYFVTQTTEKIVVDGVDTYVTYNRFLYFNEILDMLKYNPFNFSKDMIDVIAFTNDSGKLVFNGKFPMPCSGQITSPWGERMHPITGQIEKHTGVDLRGQWHQPIKTIADGIVSKVNTANSGYGNYIMIQHTIDGEMFYSFYAHLSLEGGDPNKDINPGNTTGHHLHFEIRLGKERDSNIDPSTYIFK